MAEPQQCRPQGGRCCNLALAHADARGARTSTKNRRPEARMVAVIPSAKRTSSAATTSAPTTEAICPPADPHSDPPGRAAPTSTHRRRTGAKAGQPKNTNAALAARDVLGGPPVRAAQQPPVRRADSHAPPSGGRWHRKLCQSQLSQRTRHARADDACGRSAMRRQSLPLPLSR